MTGIPFLLCLCLRLVTGTHMLPEAWVMMLPREPAGFPPPDLCCRTSELEAPASRVDLSMGIHVLAQLQQVGPMPPDFLL